MARTAMNISDVLMDTAARGIECETCPFAGECADDECLILSAGELLERLASDSARAKEEQKND